MWLYLPWLCPGYAHPNCQYSVRARDILWHFGPHVFGHDRSHASITLLSINQQLTAISSILTCSDGRSVMAAFLHSLCAVSPATKKPVAHP